MRLPPPPKIVRPDALNTPSQKLWENPRSHQKSDLRNESFIS